MPLPNLNSYTQAEQLRAISLILASQPSLTWIEKLKTEDQFMYWLEYRRRFHWVAKCWVSRSTFQDDPLRPLLNAGRISRNEYNILWSMQVFFDRMWSLCQHVEPFFQEPFEKVVNIEYPFDNALVLFGLIVGELVNPNIALCLTPYIECPARNKEKALRLQIKAMDGTRLTKAQEKLVDKYEQEQFLGGLLLAVAQELAKKELIIKYALEDYQTAVKRLLKCFATECHTKRSHGWSKGEVMYSSKSTTYSC